MFVGKHASKWPAKYKKWLVITSHWSLFAALKQRPNFAKSFYFMGKI